jgi:hypothetical protein
MRWDENIYKETAAKQSDDIDDACGHFRWLYTTPVVTGRKSKHASVAMV